MDDTCIYSKYDVCAMLGISIFTIDNWYRWEKKKLKAAVQKSSIFHSLKNFRM